MSRVLMATADVGAWEGMWDTCDLTLSTDQARTGARSFRNTGAQSATKWISARQFLYGRCAVYMTNCTDMGHIMWFVDHLGDIQAGITWGGPSKPLAIRRGTTIIDTGPELSYNAWRCLEWYLHVDNAEGIFQVKVDGTLVIDFSGDTQGTSNANVASFRLGGYTGFGGSGAGYFDDIVIDDAEWPGRGGLEVLVPVGAGTYSQLTPSAGNNWECVDDIPPDGDTSYVESATLGHKDSYEMSNLTVVVGTVHAVQWVARGRVVDAGTRNIARLLRIDGTDYQGSDLALPATYAYQVELLPENPATDGAWSIADVNALEAGVVVR